MSSKSSSSQGSEDRIALTVPREEAHELLSEQIKGGEELLTHSIGSFDDLRSVRSQYKVWRDYTTELLKRIATSDSLSREFSRIGAFVMPMRPPPLREEINELHGDIRQDLERLESIRARLKLFPTISEETTLEENPSQVIESLLRRFHLVVRQLRDRHEDRPTLDIGDEFDVQDLLHSLLRLTFDDIRAEEWTPSYAGGASRMDFLLKREETVIEVKKTRKGVRDRQIGDQLLEDIGRYAEHPNCKILYCFVYDPDGQVANPGGLEGDLTRTVNELSVRVIVAPKGH